MPSGRAIESSSGAPAVIGVLYAGDVRDPTAWSGIPRGLTDGLMAVGIDVRPINVALPERVRELLRRLHTPDPEMCRVQSFLARRRLSTAGKLDGIVQMGTEFTVSTSVPTATYEDMTVVQHDRHSDEWFFTFTPRARRIWLERQRAAYANASACCVTTQWAADSVVGDYGVEDGKVRVVGLGANHVIEPPDRRDWSVPRFLIVARDWRRKNVDLVVRTFAELRAEQPPASLDVVGPYPGESGPGVTLHGPLSLGSRDERRFVEDLFRRATCYVMPSTHEASAQTFIEAAHAGLPSIGTIIGGVAELIGDGGVVVDPKDPTMLLEAMRRLSDPDTAQVVGARAREHIAWYTWPQTARRVVDALGLGIARP